MIPGDGTLAVTWDVAPRAGVADGEIRHALRWSQESGVWANPDPDPDTLTLSKNDGIAVDGGVTGYTIDGLQNGVSTGVFVRSFTGNGYSERAPGSSRWVRVKGDRTTPGPVPQQLTPPDQQPQQQQQSTTPLWSATLTPKAYGTNPTTLGCANGFTPVARECSTTTTLTDDDFVLGGTTYTITNIWWTSQQTVSMVTIPPVVQITLDQNVPDALLQNYSLTIGSDTFSPGQFDKSSLFPDRLRAPRSGLPSWTLDQAVTMSLQLAVTAPGAPTGLALTPGDGSLSASWTAPTNTGGAAISGYDVEYKTDSASDVAATTANDPTTGWTDANVSVSGTTATITSLTNGTAYDVRVRAKNSAGTAPWSATATETPAAPVHQGRCASQSTDANSPLIRDCRTLIGLKDGLDPNNKLNWAEGTALGSWGGVTSSAAAGVTELRLSNRGLGGIVPAGLGQLPSLRELALWSNGLSGRIPSELGQPANMLGLSLGNNQLSGSIPAELGQLGKLQLLSLSRNRLDGSIPGEFGQLTGMTQLYLYSNNLSGSIPAELGQLTSLTRLYLHDNNLSGQISAQLGNLAALRILYMWRNQLSGSIPGELGQLTALRELWLSRNRLSGSIPTQLGNLAALQELELSRNRLTGSIPAWLGNLAKLQVLRLACNDFSGAVPTGIGDLSELTEIDLHGNPRLLLVAADLPGNLVRQGREVVLSGPCEPTTPTTPTTPTAAVHKWGGKLLPPNQGPHTGCDDSGANKCSTLLSDNWFNYYDRKYTVEELSLNNGELRLRLDKDIPEGMRAGGYLQFHVSRSGFSNQQPVVLELPGDSDFTAGPKLLKWTGIDGHWNGRHFFSLYTYPHRDPKIAVSVSPSQRDFAEGSTAEVTITVGPLKGRANVAVNLSGDAQVSEDYGVRLAGCADTRCNSVTAGFHVLPGGLLARQYTFGASTTEQTVTFNIDIEDDAESEGEETITVSAGIQFSGRYDPNLPQVHTPEFAADLRDSLTLTIPANDMASFTVSPRRLNVNEGARPPTPSR